MKLCALTPNSEVLGPPAVIQPHVCVSGLILLFTWTLLFSCCNLFSLIHSKMSRNRRGQLHPSFFFPLTHIYLNTHMDWTRCKICAALSWICILIWQCKWAAQGDVGQSCICNGKYSDLMRREGNLYSYTQRLLSLPTSALHQIDMGFKMLDTDV